MMKRYKTPHSTPWTMIGSVRSVGRQSRFSNRNSLPWTSRRVDMSKRSAGVSDEEVVQRVKDLYETCRRHGLRMTPQRASIFEVVAESCDHPDVERIYEKVRHKVPNISIDTVYRNLTQLEKLGVISRVDPLCGRARFDANPKKHQHFVCTTCHAVTDIYLTDDEQPVLPVSASNYGHALSLHLQVRGTCHKCAEASTHRQQQSADDSARSTIQLDKE